MGIGDDRRSLVVENLKKTEISIPRLLLLFPLAKSVAFLRVRTFGTSSAGWRCSLWAGCWDITEHDSGRRQRKTFLLLLSLLFLGFPTNFSSVSSRPSGRWLSIRYSERRDGKASSFNYSADKKSGAYADGNKSAAPLPKKNHYPFCWRWI